MEKAWKDAITAAQPFVVVNQFGEIIEQKGGQGLNALTSNEETGYHYSFPSNQVELWAYLESERFLHRVMREFYKEREVVHEERRLGESQPFGRLFEQFAATAYLAHPYGQPVVGWPLDLESFSATDAENFYRKYYVPANMILTLVGDVKPGEVLPITLCFYRAPNSHLYRVEVCPMRRYLLRRRNYGLLGWRVARFGSSESIGA